MKNSTGSLIVVPYTSYAAIIDIFFIYYSYLLILEELHEVLSSYRFDVLWELISLFYEIFQLYHLLEDGMRFNEFVSILYIQWVAWINLIRVVDFDR